MTGLVAGTAYTFSVTAVNGAGSSAAAAVATATPPDDDLPGAVRDLRAAAVNATTARLAWVAPFTRGAPANYAVAGGGTATVSGAGASIAGLIDGGSYTFAVTGSNSLGAGEAATVEVAAGAPGAVRDLTVRARTASTVDLSWTAPSGGGTPTGYAVAGGGTARALPGNRTRIAGLTPDTAYTFSVNAYNDAGSGTAAGGNVATPTVEAAPGPVRELRIGSAGADAVRLSWAIPDTGGAPTVYAVGGGGTATVTGTGASIAGLAADGTYTFSVAGSNAAGAAQAATVEATTGTPGTVRGLRVDGKTADAVNLSWLPPGGGGTPTGYSVAGGGTAVVEGTRARIAGLSVDTAYTFTVGAVNAAGAGAGTAIDVRTVDFMPTLEALGDRAATVDVELSFALPEADGGNAPLVYALSGLPGTLSFDAASRTVSGTPTTVESHSLTYAATDNDGDTAEATFTLTIEADEEPTLSVSDRAAAANKPMNLALPEAGGGNAPLRYALSGLPGTLSFDAASRTVSGTPTTVKSHSLAYTATDRDGDRAEAPFALTIEEDTAPVSPSLSDETGVENLALSLTLAEATGGNAPLTHALSGLPGTLSFDAASRTVSGTPGTGDVGDRTLTYTVADADGDTDSESFTLAIEDDTEPAVTADDVTAVPGTALDVTLPEGGGGNAPLSHALSGLPDTLSFDATTRKLSGTPGTDDVGDRELTYTVTDRDGDTVAATFTLSVGSSPGTVENLEATSVGTDSVSLSWDAPSTGGAPTGYAVAGGGTATVSGTTATIAGLANATAYIFSVTASNTAGSGNAVEIAVTTGTPGAVGNLIPTSVGSTSVSLSWNAPATGGTPTSYTVAGGGAATVAGTTATITGLTDATAYTFSVTADNTAGSGTATRIAATTGAPGAVGNLAPAAVGATSASLSWDAPGAGGTPTGYVIVLRQAPDGGETPTTAGAGTATVSGTARTFSGLREGGTYTFSVSAGNAAGSGATARITFTTGAPGEVRNLMGRSTGTASASLDWDAPTTGGTATGYSVTASGVAASQIVVSGTSATVTGLSAGTSYTFSVTASNAGGSSSAETVGVPTWRRPGAVRNLSGSADGTSRISLDWDAPATGNPAAFTYSVSASRVSASQISVSATGATVTGLTADTGYTFSVAAINSAGTGPAEAVAVVTDENAPGPVRNLEGAATGTATASLDWDAPNSGGTVSGYWVDSTGVDASRIAITGTGATVTGLKKNTRYSFRVYATNGSGWSSSRTVIVTTWDPPGPPENLDAAATGTTTVSLRWDPPKTGNPPAFTYSVSASGVDASQISVSGTSATVTGLSCDTAYTFSVTASNSAGSGTDTVSVTTRLAVPGAVLNLGATATGTTTVSLDWDAPTTCGSPTGYTVSGSGSIKKSGTGATVTGLACGTPYTWSVTADNASGSSTARSVGATTSWPAPRNLDGEATGATTVSLDWDAPDDCTLTGYAVNGSGTIAVSGTGATISGLTGGTSYMWNVSATFSGGTSASRSVTVLTKPNPVKKLGGSIAGSESVSLDWEAPDGGAPTGYTVSGSGKITVSGTGATVTGLTIGTTPQWTVTADNDSGLSISRSVTVVFDIPGTVRNFSGSATGTTAASLDWDAPNTGGTPTGYTVSGSGTITVSGTGATATELTAGTSHMFSVKADNNAGSSDSQSATVLTPPGPPKNLTGSATDSTSVSLDWDPPDGGAPMEYMVSGSGTISVSGTSATVTELTANTKYMFSVTASNEAGKSSAGPANVTTTPNPVGNLRVIAVFARSLTLGWDAPNGGATSYIVTGGTTVNTAGTMVAIMGLTPITTYNFSVTASGEGGTSLPRTITVTTPPPAMGPGGM